MEGGARGGWPADVRDLAARWYGPIGDPESWRAAGFLGTGVAVCSAAFVVVALLAVAIALVSWTVVGLVLVIPGFAVVGFWSDLERRRARMIGVTVEPRPVARRPGLVASVRVRLGDEARWRQVGYHLSAAFVALALALLGLGAWIAVVYLVTLPAWGWAVGLSLIESFVLAVLGLTLAGAPPRVVVGVARLGAGYAAWLLGPDRYAVMQSQVEHLTADRRQIIEAVAGERRRIERNLHDGVQTRLVALGIDLGLAAQMLPDRPEEARALLSSASAKNRASIAELRAIGRGLHPAVLDDRGIDAALSAVVGASPVPIRLRCDLPVPPPRAVEEAAYFVVTEAVSNVLKHARARSASIDLVSDATALRISVRDDGIGGADAARGTGLDGIDARVRALDGMMELASPAGGPTVLTVELPMTTGAPVRVP